MFKKNAHKCVETEYMYLIHDIFLFSKKHILNSWVTEAMCLAKKLLIIYKWHWKNFLIFQVIFKTDKLTQQSTEEGKASG